MQDGNGPRTHVKGAVEPQQDGGRHRAQGFDPSQDEHQVPETKCIQRTEPSLLQALWPTTCRILCAPLCSLSYLARYL